MTARLLTLAVAALAVTATVARADDATLSVDAGAIFKDCADCPELVVIPPGDFVMGYDGGVAEDRYEGPPHPVTIGYAFAIGRMEISNAQFGAFVEDTGYEPGTDCRMWDGTGVSHIPGKDWRDPGYGRPPAANEPAACISWYDAKAYVGWLAKQTGQPYRLPTEAEWEYVARGGSQTDYAWGNDPDAGCFMANYYDESAAGQRPWDPVGCDDGHAIVAPIGSLQPNPFGLYDIIGNVWEWVEDCYIMPYGVQPTDGSDHQVDGACERRGVRGGAWHSRATWQRPSFRGRDTEDFVTQVFGIRVARDLK